MLSIGTVSIHTVPIHTVPIGTVSIHAVPIHTVPIHAVPMTTVSTTTAVVTIVSGRHQHLINQQRGLRLGSVLPDHYVVVAMADPAALDLTAAGPMAGTECTIHQIHLTRPGPLPLAAARNAGAAAALAAGAEILIFLDVDCVPSVSLVANYRKSVGGRLDRGLFCGVVRYLGAEADGGHLTSNALDAPPHPARPNPDPGTSIRGDDWWLFWSLSFAVSASDWRELGGFCEEYEGYGAEDTDLGYRAHRAGMALFWLGGTDAFHQYHPTESPPTRHLVDIIANATIFHRRWGFWPMEGWLKAFSEAGLATYDAGSDCWTAN